MRRLLGVLTVAGAAAAAACGGQEAPPAWDQIAASDAVKPLAMADTGYRIIYHPAVDLAKKAGS